MCGDGRSAVLVGGDALALVELHADLLEPEPFDERAAPDGDEHQIGLNGLAVAEVHRELRAVVLDLRALLAELQRDAALPNCFASSFEASASSCGMSESSISTIVTSEPKRLKIDANSQPMMPPPRMTRRLGCCSCASRPVESTQRGESRPSIGGRSGNEPVAMTACLKLTSSPPSTASVFASLKRPAALHPLDAVRLEEPRDAVRHLLDDAGLPGVGRAEVELSPR